MVGTEFGINNMKAWTHPALLNGSGCCWWCNGVGDIFLPQFGHLSTNRAWFKHHSQPEYFLTMSIPLWPQCTHLVMGSPNHNPIVHLSDLHDAIMSIWTKISENCFSTLLNLCQKEDYIYIYIYIPGTYTYIYVCVCWQMWCMACKILKHIQQNFNAANEFYFYYLSKIFSLNLSLSGQLWGAVQHLTMTSVGGAGIS